MVDNNAVVNWDDTVHKNVRSSDGEPVGNIVAVMGDSLQIETAGSRGQYLIPKDRVAGFDGAEVTLGLPYGKLAEFERPGA